VGMVEISRQKSSPEQVGSNCNMDQGAMLNKTGSFLGRWHAVLTTARAFIIFYNYM
jgi:hypothetical protein